MSNFGMDQNQNQGGDLIDDTPIPVNEEYTPIQKNPKLFKFILYATKVEIKFSSLVKLIYNTSLYELGIWFIGFLIFIASPSNMWLIWILIVHIAKGVMGFILLDNFPKTQDIMENVAKEPNFDENQIVEKIQTQIKETFIKKWSEKRNQFLIYLIATILCVVIDLIIFIVQIAVFGEEEWILMQTCMLFIILVFIISDVVYFLWYITLRFSLPAEIQEPVKKAIMGSVRDLKSIVLQKFKRNKRNNNISDMSQK